ncbi:MAG: bifunctional 4-hydroxy-2-oxoglutarate aldolase/2-dehydro-3-deoxy-phosphogluconate aldolase [Hyphomicrobiales bacterium]
MGSDRQAGLEGLLRRARIVPVLIVEAVEDAVPLARALAEGGLDVLEITLRTSAAADAIRAIRDALPDIVVGSGTVLDPRQLALSEELGCAFAVCPGASPALLAAASDRVIPLLSASATPSEAMVLREQGYAVQKFFPAEACGGTRYLSAIASPLPDVSFCPTGGITEANAREYLMLPNVVAVGGSWMAPRRYIADKNWPAVAEAARIAASLRMTRT